MNITTDKDAFLYVKESLIKQNDRSIGTTEDCQYRGWSSKKYLELQDQLRIDGYDNDSFYDVFYDELLMLPQDSKCAIGYLISDSVYDPAYEGNGICEEVMDMVINSNPSWVINNTSTKMLEVLQTIHDRVEVQQWSESFSVLEKYFTESGEFNTVAFHASNPEFVVHRSVKFV